MRINKEVLHKLARLSQLEIEADAEGKLMEDLNKILDWADQIAEPDIDEDADTDVERDAAQSLRADVLEPPLPRSSILRNAPGHHNGYIAVPLNLNTSDGHEE